jgi:hypothetical protein
MKRWDEWRGTRGAKGEGRARTAGGMARWEVGSGKMDGYETGTEAQGQ